MDIDPEGRLPAARQVPSPNCDERPEGERIDLLVIHNISLPPGEFGGDAVERLFTNSLDYSQHPYFEQLRGLRVSAHFLVRRDGGLVQFVPVGLRAWHAGESWWRGRGRCNDFSIGVELEGTDDSSFTAEQYRSLAALTKTLRSAYPLTDIVGHSDISPGRKTDPGACFDWDAFRRLLAP
jgi:AmpD protein